jgi:hypothetical protein
MVILVPVEILDNLISDSRPWRIKRQTNLSVFLRERADSALSIQSNASLYGTIPGGKDQQKVQGKAKLE